MSSAQDTVTENAIIEAIRVDKPVVADTTTGALTWLGAAYLAAIALISFASEAVVYINPTSLPDWFVRAGGLAVIGSILRIAERVVRYQLQQRGEG